MKILCYSAFLLLSVPVLAQSAIDSSLLMETIRTLSDNKFEGRKTGTRGNRMAQFYIRDAFKKVGVVPYNGTYEYPFYFEAGGKRIMGTNLYGYIQGKSDQAIVITAHYDHLGVGKPPAPATDSIYNGADDNASGVSAMLAIAQYFHQHPPQHTLIFAALDAEEMGLEGAKAFLQHPPVPVAQMKLNINMDMVSRNDNQELYVCGTHQFPELKEVITAVAPQSKIKLVTGHDKKEDGANDWTSQSDHFEFFKLHIPFLYFGVEDHPDYHKVSDEFSRIHPAFFYQATTTIRMVISAADKAMMAGKFRSLKVMEGNK
ncbi:M28 family peptidase [Chitinophaga defluvii]|uniref:M28 family peptidase n=1 Tax=Chitinophaga defluvii TaxID=3163343 RepID=A0ABV2T942_9BACT